MKYQPRTPLLPRGVPSERTSVVASAEREIELFFDDEELLDYERIDETWLYE